MPSVSLWLTWFLIALIPVAAVALRLLAGDDPRSDEPPDDPGECPLPGWAAA